MENLKNKLHSLRNDYDGEPLDENSVAGDPLQQFEKWMNEALEKNIYEPNAMILATADKRGVPSVRVVLLRDYSEKGFVFYTHYESRKGKEIDQNPHASLLFFWPALQRQIRIEGVLEKTDPSVSAAYFKSRPVGNQISAWASPQSTEVKSKHILEENYKDFEKKYAEKEIPYPEFWGGYCLKPVSYEFWQGQMNRLHDRIQYTRQAGEASWNVVRLAP